MLNDTCANFTNDNPIDQSLIPFYVKLFVFTGMLISVIFIPTHLFLLYVTDNIETVKGKNFMALMLMLLIKYLLILLNTILGITQLTKFPNIMIFGLIYVHLSATCWLCIITEHCLNIIKKTIWKFYNVRWISVSVSSILGWISPLFFVLLAYLFTVAAVDHFCMNVCTTSNICQARIFFIVFVLSTFILLVKSCIDVVRVKYYISCGIPTETNIENVVSDFDYINFGLMFCIIFLISWILEIVCFVQSNAIIQAISVASSVEAILIVLGTLWWKKCISYENTS